MKEIVDSLWNEEVEFLQELIRIPSDNPPGNCAGHAERTAELLEEMGLTVVRLPVPEPYVHQHGMKSLTNLIVKKSFGSGTGMTVALNAHGDAVPPGDGWTEDPYGGAVRNGCLFGRGAVMSKSDFATYVFALRCLVEQNSKLDGNVEIHLTYDEERGGFMGPKWLIEHGHTKPDVAITAGMTHTVTTSLAGCLHLEIVIRGRQAHAALPESGADAIKAATPVLVALYNEKERIEKTNESDNESVSPKFTVGTISGGTHTNVVPDRVSITLDRRLSPSDSGEKVEQDLISLIEGAFPEQTGLEVECRRIMLAEPLKPVDGVDKLSNLVTRIASEVLGHEIHSSNMPLFSDARHYSEAGIPTVMYGAGPGSLTESNAHGADENLNLTDLRASTEVIARALKELLTH